MYLQNTSFIFKKTPHNSFDSSIFFCFGKFFGGCPHIKKISSTQQCYCDFSRTSTPHFLPKTLKKLSSLIAFHLPLRLLSCQGFLMELTRERNSKFFILQGVRRLKTCNLTSQVNKELNSQSHLFYNLDKLSMEVTQGCDLILLQMLMILKTGQLDFQTGLKRRKNRETSQ